MGTSFYFYVLLTTLMEYILLSLLICEFPFCVFFLDDLFLAMFVLVLTTFTFELESH